MAFFSSIKSIASAMKAISKAVSAITGYFRDRRLVRAGRDAERVETQDEVMKNVEKSNDAKHSLNDDDKRDGVRDRFSRD